MAHISLYRRYRPDSFDTVIGQTHIVRTLVNQIKSDSISHAYLFTGTRGTGKTTVARIFARAINCEHPVNGNPCGKCDTCKEMMTSGNMDILEVDAASNSSVDEIRDLREKIKYPPVVGRYKVYIIDEVHMLSTSAFNALLKTLEEPPSHAVFILATTDVHKLPQTILSRCMRFDFKLLSIDEISYNLKRIFDDIGKKYSDEAVNLIATAAEGSMRDSLSIADMCVAYSDETIKYEDVLEVLGASDPNVVIDLVKSIILRDISKALEIINSLSNYGKNIAVLNKDVATYIRDIIYIKNCKSAESILKLPHDIYVRLKEIADNADNTQLLSILDIFNSLSGELRYSTHPRIMFEASVVRATTECGITELSSRIKRVEDKISSGNIVSANTAQKKTNLEPENPVDLSPANLWDTARTELLNKDKYFALGIAMNKFNSARIEDNTMYVTFAKAGDASIIKLDENKKLIEEKILALSGKNLKISVNIEGEDNSSDVIVRLKNLFGDDLKITK